MSQLNYIDIDLSSIPYEFDIQLEGTTFTLGFNYNSYGDFFTVDLSRGGTILASNEKIVYGKPLFDPKTINENGTVSIIPRTPSFPCVVIIPLDTSNNQTAVNWSNLNSTVFLYVLTGDDFNNVTT